VRDPDGLAASSRNRYLSAADRPLALGLSRALRAGEARAAEGADAVLAAVQRVLRAEPALVIDYVAVVDPRTFTSVRAGQGGPAVIVAAATAGNTRLIDNMPVVLAADRNTKGHSRDAADH
jgi:pantoate--beta-alanine ligase